MGYSVLKQERLMQTLFRLSITKWIQLHGGDKGLKSFFKKVYDSLAPGGTFVLEPQDFDTFQKRAKQIDVSSMLICLFLLFAKSIFEHP
jgi:7SK snRNA methylphosphate capping enzyme